MKRVIFMLTAMLMLLPLFGQDGEPQDFKSVFLTYSTIAAATTFLAEIVVRLLQVTVKLWKVVIVVGVAVLLSFIGNLINVGYLAEATWWETLLWGGLSGATAAGVRSGNILWIKSIVEFLVSFLKKEPTS